MCLGQYKLMHKHCSEDTAHSCLYVKMFLAFNKSALSGRHARGGCFSKVTCVGRLTGRADEEKQVGKASIRELLSNNSKEKLQDITS